MKRLREALLGLWLLLCLLVFFSGTLMAGDCSGPDDCSAPPDNASKAAAGGGALVGAYIYVKSREKDDQPDYGEGEAEDVDALLGQGKSTDEGEDQKDSDKKPDSGEDDSDLDMGGSGN